MAAFELLDSALVDDRPWYTVKCTDREIMKWVRQQPEDQWYEHIDVRGYIDLRIIDIHEELFTMLKLRWS
jgi:hypothetical protein